MYSLGLEAFAGANGIAERCILVASLSQIDLAPFPFARTGNELSGDYRVIVPSRAVFLEIEIEIETRSRIAARDRPLVKGARCTSRPQLWEFHGSMSLNNVSAILSPPPSLSGNEMRR